MNPLITTSQREHVRIVSLNRPDRRNALTPAMIDDLVAAIAAPSQAGCLLLRGEGAVFCSGFDLSLCEADPDGHIMRRLLASLSAAIRVMRGLPTPVVVAAQGAAIAGGCALLGGADVVVADRGAKLGYPVVRLGVSPAVSAATFALLVGPGPTRRLMLDPGLIDGVEAHRLGVAHLLVDQAVDVDDAATRTAIALAAKPSEALTATREWLAHVESVMLGDLAPGADAGLAASMGLVGGAEERRMLRVPVRTRSSKSG